MTDISGGVIRIRAQNHYTKFGFIPDPEGSPYDIGFGHLLQHLNESANTAINQMLDQGHRYTMGGGFIGEGLRIKSGEMRFKPGEFKRVKSGGMPIRENIVNLPMGEPSMVLMALQEYLINGAEGMAAMARVMAGDIPANMPAATALATIEQGMQPFKAIFKRVHRSLEKEYKRLFYLNRQYLTQEEYSRVLDDPAADVELDFASNSIDITPVSDQETLTTMQSSIRAQFLMSFLQDPYVDGIELRRRIFSAMSIKDVDDLLVMPRNAPDPVVIAQVSALEAQILDMKNRATVAMRKADRDDIKQSLEIETAIVDMKKKTADGQLSLARAEAEEAGSQLAEYKTRLDALGILRGKLKERTASGNSNDGRGMAEMEEPAGDGDIL